MLVPVDLYGMTYGHFASPATARVRRETYGQDFGQSSWTTAGELRRFLQFLSLGPACHLLDVACGSGGPALFLANELGCRVTGVDLHPEGLLAGHVQRLEASAGDRVRLCRVDLRRTLPFAPGSFDAMICIDAVCHLPNRGGVFREWHRVLGIGARVLFTDPVVVTGLVTRDDFALRGATGHFEFAPVGTNERLLREAGFDLELAVDATAGEVEVSGRWIEARERAAAELMPLEGEETFRGIQRFLEAVHRLASERRLSRFLYLARKPRA